MASYLENRHIRIFISSTFEDMKEERDLLIRKVFPRLNRKAMERGVSINAIDLRWGITEENVRNGKVVRICLNEIENSHPFFIGLLGDRYGWCPNSDILKQDSILASRYQWIKEEIEQDKSMTEIEINYGALRNSKEDCFAYFFLKEDGEKTESKQRILKDRIRSQKDHPSYIYSNLNELEWKVEETFEALLDKLFPSTFANEIGILRKIHQRYFISLCQTYIREEEYFKELDNFLYNEEDYYIRKAIIGEYGIGKSALMANWIKEKLEDDNYHIAYLFFGDFISNSNSKIIWQLFQEQLCEYSELSQEELLKMIQDENVKDFEIFVSILTYIHTDSNGKKPLLVVIDGAQQYFGEYNFKRMMQILNLYSMQIKNFKALISASYTSEQRLWGIFGSIHDCPLIISSLKERQKFKFIEEYLSQYGKKLEPTQIKKIVKTKLYDKPLALRVLLDELISLGMHDKLDHYIQYYCGAYSIEGLFKLVLENYEEIFGLEIVSRILCTIAVSENGMYEEELIHIAGSDQLNWSAFYSSFSKYFYIKNGLVQLPDNYVRNAVLSRYINKEGEKNIRYRLINYLKHHKKIQENDISKNNVWIWNELIHQYLAMESCNYLYQIVMRKNVFQYYIKKNGEILDKVWKSLLNDKSRVFSLLDYLDGDFKVSDIVYLLDVSYFTRTYFSNTDISDRALFKVLEIVNDLSRRKPCKLEAYVRIMKSEKYRLPENFRNQQLYIEKICNELKCRWNINEEENTSFFWFIAQFLHKIGQTIEIKYIDSMAYAKIIFKESLKIRDILAKKNKEKFLPEVGESLFETGKLYTNIFLPNWNSKRIMSDMDYLHNCIEYEKKLKQKHYNIAIRKFTQALNIFNKFSGDTPHKHGYIKFQIRKHIADLRSKLI